METSLTLRRWLPRLLPKTVGRILVLLLMWTLSRPKELTGTQSILCGNAFVSVGLSGAFTTGEEGADWRTFPDWPHSSLPDDSPITPDDEARTILRSAGLQAVWNAAFGDQAVEKIPG